MDEEPKKLKLPRWAKRLLVVLSIIGPLSGAVVSLVSAIFDIRTKATEAKTQTKAGYETLAPAVKELQDLLAKSQDAIDAQEKEISQLKEMLNAQDRRVIRLETYVEILGRGRNLPSRTAEPPPLQSSPRIHKVKPIRPVPSDINTAEHFQDAKVILKCSPGDPTCDVKAADMAAQKP